MACRVGSERHMIWGTISKGTIHWRAHRAIVYMATTRVHWAAQHLTLATVRRSHTGHRVHRTPNVATAHGTSDRFIVHLLLTHR